MNTTMIVGRGGEVFAEVVQAVNEMPGTSVNSPTGEAMYRIVRIVQFQILQSTNEETGRPHWNIFALVEIAQESTIEGAVSIAAMLEEEPVDVEQG